MRQSWLIIILSLCAFCGLVAALSTNDKSNGLYNTPSSPASELLSNNGHGKLTLWPLDWVDIALFVVIAICLSLAGGAGIGGGAILVPVFLMLRGWPTAIAVAMSNVTVLGGSLANFVCNVNRHRPNGARTIDWELILMMEPTTIAGALFGAMLNKLLPNYITTYLLTILLTFMALRLYHKGREAYAKETKLLKAARHAARAAARQAAAEPLLPDEQLQPGGRQDFPVRTSSQTIRPSRPDSRSLTRSFSRSVSRSISRLSGPMISRVPDASPHGLSPWRAASTPTTAVTADNRAGRSPSGTSPHLGAAATAAAAAVAAAPGASQGAAEVPWLPEFLRRDSSAQLLDVYHRSTLFQGDVHAENVEPLVVLPLEDELSSWSSLSSDSEINQDEEAGPAGHGYGDDDYDLSQPLLAAAAAATAHSAASAPAAAQLEGWPSPHAVVQVDDIQHGQRDVAGDAGAESFVKGQQHVGALQGQHAAAAKPAVVEPPVPILHLLTLVLLSAWVVASETVQHSTSCGSWQYWAVTLSVLAPVALILLVFRQVLLRKYRHDDLAPGAVLPEGQLHWTRTTTLLYPLLCTSAGLIAGLFGIGGGVVKGPLMLELGVAPDIAAATSATMIMFTAGSACVVYSRFGHILLDYGVLLAGFGFFTTLGSQLLTFVLIRLLGRRSVIIFMMVTLMTIACGIMYVQSALVTKAVIEHPEELSHFGRLCPGENRGVGHAVQQLLLWVVS